MRHEVQAILFDKHRFTAEDAKRILQELDYTPIKAVHITEHYRRYRIREPEEFREGTFRTYDSPTTRGLKFIIGAPKPVSTKRK